MKVEIPIGNWKSWLSKPLHTVVAVGVAALCLWLIADIGGAIFGGNGESGSPQSALGHLVDMSVFGLVGFALVGVFLYAMRFTVLQAIFLPGGTRCATWRKHGARARSRRRPKQP